MDVLYAIIKRCTYKTYLIQDKTIPKKEKREAGTNKSSCDTLLHTWMFTIVKVYLQKYIAKVEEYLIRRKGKRASTSHHVTL